jgi:hypothetical protein
MPPGKQWQSWNKGTEMKVQAAIASSEKRSWSIEGWAVVIVPTEETDMKEGDRLVKYRAVEDNQVHRVRKENEGSYAMDFGEEAVRVK